MVRKIRDEFRTTIFLTTHYLEESDNLSDTICIMKEGQEIIQGSPFELKEYLKQDNIKITLSSKDNAKKLRELLLNTYSSKRIVLKNTVIMISTKNSTKTFDEILLYLINNHISFNGIEIVQPALEDVFLRLTEKELII